MLVLMRVMNSTYFFALRDCSCGAAAVVGVVVVVVGVVTTAGLFVLAAELLVWPGVLDAESPAEVVVAAGAGVACGEEEEVGAAVC